VTAEKGMSVEREKPLVAVFDVRIPKRHIIRYVKPLFSGENGGPKVLFAFLNNKRAQNPELCRSCNNLEDSELVEELLYRHQRNWGKVPCFFFTSDRKFYLENHRTLRESDIILIFVPLINKNGAIPRRKVIKILKCCIAPVLQRACHWHREYGEMAVARLKARFCPRNRIQPKSQ